MTDFVPSLDLVDAVLKGEVPAIARLITRAEQGDDECRDALGEILRHTGQAHIVGITGVPGSGKSTLVTVLCRAIRASGRRIGIVAIDPTSPFSGGSILGDRIRMNEHSSDAGVFIRSMATRGAMGGLARACASAVDVLDAAGFDMVLIETVGVGQDEVDIVRAAHTTVVVSAPGLGDDIQAIKAGILEIADIHVVSKCDRADADRTVAELKRMQTLDPQMPEAGAWHVPVIATSALDGTGVTEMLDMIDDHLGALKSSGQWRARCRRMVEARLLKMAGDILRDEFERHRDGHVAELIDRLMASELDPYTAARTLMKSVMDEMKS